jgi:nitrite reductase/ring-hydroxylating ferredoxin subunit
MIFQGDRGVLRAMKRAPALVELTRRDFCAFASAIALVGCTSGPSAIQTGGLTGDDDQGPPDAPGTTLHDASVIGGDAAPAPTCPATGVTDVGAAATFALNTPIYFAAQKIFVIRDSAGLYALTASCTHEGATCNIQNSEIYCPRHGAFFTLDGAVISGPPNRPLQHYAMCTLAGGHVGVVLATKVAATQRLVA